MAHGLFCKHCGQQETPHVHGAAYDFEENHKNGYHHSLTTCPGFDLNQKDARINEDYMESNMAGYESQAKQRAAWGAYASHVSTLAYERMSDKEKRAAEKAPRLLIIG